MVTDVAPSAPGTHLALFLSRRGFLHRSHCSSISSNGAQRALSQIERLKVAQKSAPRGGLKTNMDSKPSATASRVTAVYPLDLSVRYIIKIYPLDLSVGSIR